MQIANSQNVDRNSSCPSPLVNGQARHKAGSKTPLTSAKYELNVYCNAALGAFCIRDGDCKARTPSRLPRVRGHQLRHQLDKKRLDSGTYDEKNARDNIKTRHQSLLQSRSQEPSYSETGKQASFGTEGKVRDAAFEQLPDIQGASFGRRSSRCPGARRCA
jgi:hypothetical protein